MGRYAPRLAGFVWNPGRSACGTRSGGIADRPQIQRAVPKRFTHSGTARRAVSPFLVQSMANTRSWRAMYQSPMSALRPASSPFCLAAA